MSVSQVRVKQDIGGLSIAHRLVNPFSKRISSLILSLTDVVICHDTASQKYPGYDTAYASFFVSWCILALPQLWTDYAADAVSNEVECTDGALLSVALDVTRGKRERDENQVGRLGGEPGTDHNTPVIARW